MNGKAMAELAETVFAAVKGYVDRELGKLSVRLDAVAAIKPEKGDKGDRGEKGEPGAFVQGERGERGERGEKGDKGESVKGDKGDRGEKGEPGISIKGDTGERGERGEKGEPGLSVKGDTGERGEKGEPGASIKGENGDRGEKGDVGERGEKGEAGLSIKGEAGERGEKGDKGADGLSIKGEKGDRGDKGEKGNDGLTVKGDKGDKGDDGRDGASAFQIAKASGFVGSEVEWLMSLRGTDGEDGEDGRDGKKGDPGRDAAQLDFVAGIDHERCYPRNTFAAFYGGMFFATRETDPLENNPKPTLCGWHPAMNGIKSDVETLEDGGRWRVRTVTMSDGTVSVQKQKTKMQIMRGVHQAGRSYDEGDVIIFDGSQWTALEDTKERPKSRDPGGPQAWALSVKRGADGRAAISDSSSRGNGPRALQ